MKLCANYAEYTILTSSRDVSGQVQWINAIRVHYTDVISGRQRAKVQWIDAIRVHYTDVISGRQRTSAMDQHYTSALYWRHLRTPTGKCNGSTLHTNPLNSPSSLTMPNRAMHAWQRNRGPPTTVASSVGYRPASSKFALYSLYSFSFSFTSRYTHNPQQPTN